MHSDLKEKAGLLGRPSDMCTKDKGHQQERQEANTAESSPGWPFSFRVCRGRSGSAYGGSVCGGGWGKLVGEDSSTSGLWGLRWGRATRTSTRLLGFWRCNDVCATAMTGRGQCGLDGGPN